MTHKYSDEQLSLILGEHAAGHLIKGGGEKWQKWDEYPRCCINQVAYNTPDNSTADFINEGPANWFDDNYRMDMSADELLNEIEIRTEELLLVLKEWGCDDEE